LSGRLAAHQSPVVISFLGATNIQTVVAARGLATKVIISERNDPALQQLNPPWERLRPVYYPEADIVTANSAGAVRTLGQFVPKGKLRQVPNALVIPPCPAGIDPHQKRFIAVARLVDQKGIDILLDAFGLIAPDLPEWELDIVGDGPNRQELHEQAERLGVSDRVTFHGHQQSPFPFYYRASVFVLSSRFEGMPNAMLEAMGCGLAIVTTDASSGPLEFVEDSVSGLTVPVDDPKALAEAMRRLAVEDELRCRLADAGRGRVQGLDPESVSEVWDGIIRELHTDFGSALAAGRST
jgi:glycosyltransferase involved in cell wall biosynthesis